MDSVAATGVGANKDRTLDIRKPYGSTPVGEFDSPPKIDMDTNDRRLTEHRPVPKDERVSAQMSRMPRRSTLPELALRKELHAAGLRFTVNRRDLPGTPDIVFSKARIAIFIDGCFWHGCSEHGVLPKNNRDWWRTKLKGNRERDGRKDAALAEMGWLTLHFWEHEAVPEMVSVVTQLWRERTGREQVVRSPSDD